MVRTPNYDLDTDTTLGGANASDYIIPSQKAIKDYVDNHSGGGGGADVDQTFDGTSTNAQSGVAVAQALQTVKVDIDEIATDLNGKADIDLSNCTKPYIIESYVNGKSGYNIYSNGFCEQWGYQLLSDAGVTVQLPKAYRDTDYIITYSITVPDTYPGILVAYINDTKTASSFVGRSPGNSPSISWCTKGYIS